MCSTVNSMKGKGTVFCVKLILKSFLHLYCVGRKNQVQPPVKGKYETKVDVDPVHLLEAEPDDAKKE